MPDDHRRPPPANDAGARATAMSRKDNPRVRQWLKPLLEFGERVVSESQTKDNDQADAEGDVQARAG
jgi:hypothetical protein